MAELNSIRLDLDAVENGRWCAYHDDIEFLVASTKCEAFQKSQRKLTSKVTRGFRTGSDGEDKQRSAAFIKAFVVDCVRGWKNLSVGGKAIKFTPAKACEILLDPAYVDALDFCYAEANDQAEFAESNLEARAKN
jgi:hypothetical protein